MASPWLTGSYRLRCGGLTGIYRICREALVGDKLAMQPRHVEAWEGPGRGTHGNGGTLLWALVR